MVGATVSEAELQQLDAAGIRAMHVIATAHGGPSIDQLADFAANVAPLGWHIEMYVPTGVWPKHAAADASRLAGPTFDVGQFYNSIRCAVTYGD